MFEIDKMGESSYLFLRSAGRVYISDLWSLLNGRPNTRYKPSPAVGLCSVLLPSPKMVAALSKSTRPNHLNLAGGKYLQYFPSTFPTLGNRIAEQGIVQASFHHHLRDLLCEWFHNEGRGTPLRIQ